MASTVVLEQRFLHGLPSRVAEDVASVETVLCEPGVIEQMTPRMFRQIAVEVHAACNSDVEKVHARSVAVLMLLASAHPEAIRKLYRQDPQRVHYAMWEVYTRLLQKRAGVSNRPRELVCVALEFVLTCGEIIQDGKTVKPGDVEALLQDGETAGNIAEILARHGVHKP